jgi:Carbohydrate-selective porin, OprB family
MVSQALHLRNAKKRNAKKVSQSEKITESVTVQGTNQAARIEHDFRRAVKASWGLFLALCHTRYRRLMICLMLFSSVHGVVPKAWALDAAGSANVETAVSPQNSLKSKSTSAPLSAIEQYLATSATSEPLTLTPSSLSDSGLSPLLDEMANAATSNELAQANFIEPDQADPSAPFDFTPPSPISPGSPLTPPSTEANSLGEIVRPVTPPSLRFQAAAIQEGDDFSARTRLQGYYFLSPYALVGATVDLTTGNAFSDNPNTGLSINELYLALSAESAPNMRLILGQIDLTSYFDRNSFAKDSLTHFFNPVFQTNPALAASQISSQPAALLHWSVTDDINFKVAWFSAGGIDNFELNSFAGELGLRIADNLVIRGTYVSGEDSLQRSSFDEIFQIDRGGGNFGLLSGDRESSYGINAEWYIPELSLGLFGRYGYYENQALDLNAHTYSAGINILDLFAEGDRLGIGYGWGLSNESLRLAQGADQPDVFEVFYDTRLSPNLRAGVSVQQRDGFSETILGFRIRADFELLDQTPRSINDSSREGN